MIKREEVEALLAEVSLMAEINGVAIGDITHSVEGDTLDALCRAWLALDAGDQCEVVESNWHEYGVIYSVRPELVGKRVHIVEEKE